MTIKINTWTTAKGAGVELHTEHLTTEENINDSGKVTFKEIDQIIVWKVILNGKEYSTMLNRSTMQGVKVIECERNMKTKQLICVAIPADVEKDVWGAYDARQAAKFSKEMTTIKRNAEITKNKESRGYCTKCGSYCYGDCNS